MSFGIEAADPHRVRRNRMWLAAAIAFGVAAATWYLWPAIRSGTSDVAAFGDAEFAPIEASLSSEVRERGRQFTWLGETATWCDAFAAITETELDDDITTIVISIGERGSCSGDPVGATALALQDRGIDALYVSMPGRDDPVADDLADRERTGFEAVHTIELLGDGVTEMPCEWWDECDASGLVAVRSADGALTGDGYERVARVIAARIG